MNLREYANRKLPGHALLGYMLARVRSVGEMGVADINVPRLRKMIERYANAPRGVFGKDRIGLYGEVADLFDALCIDGLTTEKYDPRKSFLGNEEIDLAILRASHEAKTHQELAEKVLHCSQTTVDNHIARLKDGARVGDMCVSAQFDYGGAFESSVHPVMLPLNLSEVYVLLSALDEYASERGYEDPHRSLAERLAGMVKGELTDYAKECLSPRLGKVLDRAREEDPVYIGDAHGASRWVMLEKRGARVRVSLTDESSLVGRIGGSGWVMGKDGNGRRRGLVIVSDADERRVVPWSQVVDIELAD